MDEATHRNGINLRAIERRWAVRWMLGEPRAMSTSPVSDLVTELHQILTNPDATDQRKYAAVRRATRLLSVFVAEAERRPSAEESAWL